MATGISFDKNRLAVFCEAKHIKRLAFFGSVLRPDFGLDSDIDVLVEFEAGHVPGLLGIARLERQLSEIFGGRTVDLRTAEDLSRYFRGEILRQAKVEYAQGG